MTQALMTPNYLQIASGINENLFMDIDDDLANQIIVIDDEF